ncbi:MarR family transcriptional regulator [Chloroflexota bacterium]
MDEKGQIQAVQKRLTLIDNPRFRWRRGDHPLLYGFWKNKQIQSKNYVILVEGPSDTWTLWFHGLSALGLPGASTWSDDYSQMLGGISIYLWVEPDSGGDSLLKAVSASLPSVKVITPPPNIKDPSELYLSDREGFLKNFNSLMETARPASELQADAISAEGSRLYHRVKPLAEDPNLIARLRATITNEGYAGDPRPALLAYIAITSRLLERPLNVIFVAQSASGKNASIEYILPFFPETAFYVIRASSPMALVYSDENFSHRTVVFWEADSLPEEGPAASAVRSLMSDQRLEYQVVEKDNTGHFIVRRIIKKGPTGLITTSTKSVRDQASTRLLMVPIPDSVEQTRAVLRSIANREHNQTNNSDISLFVDFQSWLTHTNEHTVSVPFATTLAEKIPANVVRIRRDFLQILTVIKTFAMLHQAQRKRDSKGKIIAEMIDYRLTRWLLEDTLSTSISGGFSPAIRETVEAVQALSTNGAPVTISLLVKRLKLAKSTVSYRVARAIEGKWLENKATGRGCPAQLITGTLTPDAFNPLPEIEDVGVCVNDPQNPSNIRTVVDGKSLAPLKNPSESQVIVGDGVRMFEQKSGGITHTNEDAARDGGKGNGWEVEI